MGLSDYLSKNYGSTNSSSSIPANISKIRKTKSSKSKKPSHSIRPSLVVHDEDDDGFTWNGKSDTDDEIDTERILKMDPNDEEVPTIVGDIYQETLPSTKKANKSSGWKRLGSTALIAKIRSPQSNNKNNNENDSLLYEDTVPKMNNGSRAGLQTAKQVLEAISLKEKKELQAMEEFMNQSAAIETIYRDASGQKVDIEQKRAEEEQKVREKETRLRKQKVMNQGLVQQLEASKRRREIEEAHNDESGGHKMSITVNDTSRNDELKQKTRYNDPAAMFSKKENDTKKSLTGLLLYQGSFPPNRFGIVPGHRWDGVDRSNGFETLWYKKQNERNAMKSLSYSMEFDE